jgi:hypothetical protein
MAIAVIVRTEPMENTEKSKIIMAYAMKLSVLSVARGFGS